jgi:hypothetical protein
MIPFLHVVCYKWGNVYSAEEVNILHSMVNRNLTIPYKFYCITDNSSGLNNNITVVDMPYEKLPGNSPKLWTFSKGFLRLGQNEYVVSLDIDIVIVDNIDFLGERPEEPFLIAKHRAENATSRGHGAVYRVKVGSLSRIWDNFISQPMVMAKKFPGENGNAFSEQLWLEHHFKEHEISYFPTEKIILFRKDCGSRASTYRLGRKAGEWGITSARFGVASLPGIGEAIVSFAGKVNPRDVRDSHYLHMRRAPFVEKYWRI